MADTNIVPTSIDGETRIRDMDLADRLGFARPRKIRDLIKRYAADLERMGPCPAVGRVVNGGEAAEFYLNRKQAIFITAKSDTDQATDITIEIIEKFDAYERGAQPDPMAVLADPAAMRGLLLTYTEKVLALQAMNDELAPKAEALDRIATVSDGALSLTEAAKALQMRPKDLVGFLSANGWIYRRAGGSGLLGYANRTNAGDLEHKITTVLRADGSEKMVEQVKVTPRGLAKLSKLITNRLSIAA